MTRVVDLFHYPIKGLSPQRATSLSITQAEGVACDRIYALALGTTRFEPERPEPLDKGHFLMLRATEELARLRTLFDQESSILTIQEDGREALRTDLSTVEGRTATEAFFTDFAGGAAKGKISLVAAQGHKFTDVSVVSPVMMRALSVINLATVRELESFVDRTIHPLRFRANVYVDGLDAGAELDWVDREVRIGPMRFRGALRTRRCAAIDVNPLTAARDTHLPKAIVRHFGHPDLGVYLEVVEDGRVSVGDQVLH